MYPFVQENLQEKKRSIPLVFSDVEGGGRILPFKYLLEKSFFLSLTISYTESHIMYLFYQNCFFYLLYILCRWRQTHHVPCSEGPFLSLFPSSWVSNLFVRWSLPRCSHGKQLYSEAEVKKAVTAFAMITTSAGGAFKNAACPYCTAVRKEHQSRAPGCSPERGTQGTRAAHGACMEGLETHPSPSSTSQHGQIRS